MCPLRRPVGLLKQGEEEQLSRTITFLPQTLSGRGLGPVYVYYAGEI